MYQQHVQADITTGKSTYLIGMVELTQLAKKADDNELSAPSPLEA